MSDPNLQKKFFFKVLLYLWQLPQNLLGLAVVKVTKAEKKDDWYFSRKVGSAVSLGSYIISATANEITLRHERGHQKQSLILGPLYLLMIGLPSVCGNLLHRVFRFNYYAQPWEHWADKLAGINRV